MGRSASLSHPGWLGFMALSFLLLTLYYGCDAARTDESALRCSRILSTGTKTKGQVVGFMKGANVGRYRSPRRVPATIFYDYQTPKGFLRSPLHPVSDATVDGIATGARIDVWYDPGDPDQSATEGERVYWEELRAGKIRGVVVLGGITLLIAALAAWITVVWMRVRRRSPTLDAGARKA